MYMQRGRKGVSLKIPVELHRESGIAASEQPQICGIFTTSPQDDEETFEAEEATAAEVGGVAAPEEELAELEGDHEMSIEDILAKFYGGAPKSADQDPSWKGPPGLLEQQAREEEQAALGRGARRAGGPAGDAGAGPSQVGAALQDVLGALGARMPGWLCLRPLLFGCVPHAALRCAQTERVVSKCTVLTTSVKPCQPLLRFHIPSPTAPRQVRAPRAARTRPRNRQA